MIHCVFTWIYMAISNTANYTFRTAHKDSTEKYLSPNRATSMCLLITFQRGSLCHGQKVNREKDI